MPALLALLTHSVRALPVTENPVTSELGLRNALADSSVPGIRIAADIQISGTYDDDPATPGAQFRIPVYFVLEFNPGCKLQKGATGAELLVEGSLPDRSQQYFGLAPGESGLEWQPGEVRGHMAGMARRPEWWGAFPNDEPSDPVESPNIDDTRGINCAIGAVPGNGGLSARPGDGIQFIVENGGTTVLLRSGHYYISAPIFLSCSRSILRGAPCPPSEAANPSTTIHAYINNSAPSGWRWKDETSQSVYTWIHGHEQDVTTWNTWSAEPDTEHLTGLRQVAMIYMGGFAWDYVNPPEAGTNPLPSQLKYRTFSTFATAVHDLELVAISGGVPLSTPLASGQQTLPMSLISNYARENFAFTGSKIEENSLIENIRGSQFSGYGIGFNFFNAINGLAIRKFYLGPVDTNPIVDIPPQPIYLPRASGACLVEYGTVKGDHLGSKTVPVNGIQVPVVAHSKWDITAINAQGLVNISHVKIENCQVGVDLIGNDSYSAINVENVDYTDTITTAGSTYIPRSAVVRLRWSHFYRWPGSHLAATISEITSNVNTDPAQLGSGKMYLLDECAWNVPHPETLRARTASTPKLEFFARKYTVDDTTNYAASRFIFDP